MTELRKFPKPATSLNELYELVGAEPAMLVKVYRGPRAGERCAAEAEILGLWRNEGFGVPAVSQQTVESISDPHLVISLLPGRSLQHVLRDPALPPERRLKQLRHVLDDLLRRHERAMQCNDVRLVHRDASTANVMLTDTAVATLDFETFPGETSVADACAVELGKVLRWAMRDLGASHIPAVAGLAVQVYTGRRDLLERLVTRTLDRPMQFWHRWRDRRRKRKDAGELTKYDVADAIVKCLRPSRA
jgi:tRNA A-37 threonylcarbamoyl transferase component Bud32